MKLFDLSIYLVLDSELCREHSLIDTTRAAVAGGATMVQLRDKTVGTSGLVEIGRALMAVLAGTGVPLIVNDDVDAALAIVADGVHVGQDDLPPSTVRARLGPEKLLGLSVETPAAARLIDPAVVDYVGLGPVFATPTKPDHKHPIGFDGLARLVELSPVPSVAIGGLKAFHVPQVLASGADGLAVVSAICGQPAPETAARDIYRAIAQSRRDAHRHSGILGPATG